MKSIVLAAAAAAVVSGCATRESANVYNPHEAGREQVVRLATVDAVRRVLIQGSQSGAGGIAGGATGAIAGSGIGQGNGSAVAAILGGVAGAVLGNSVEDRLMRKDALEITVKLDSGELRAIVQEADVEFQPGQRVRLVAASGVTRVTP
ncbi:MAG: glycine zipper 2TM domain-containing protein [Betaproteobacteria bacterium]